MNTNMNARILGLFSGFPEHHFSDAHEVVLRENLYKRDSIVFISADPENYVQNDDDRDGMHEMFAERGLAFAEKHIIDRRTNAKEAVRLVREADCIWLMGGESKRQLELIRDLKLVSELRESRAMVLGVSAGSMNLGHYVAYVWDKPEFYEAIGLTNITIKAHFEEGEWFLPTLLKMSMIHPIVAMEDMSAIFVKGKDIWKIGNMHLVDRGELRPIIDNRILQSLLLNSEEIREK